MVKAGGGDLETDTAVHPLFLRSKSGVRLAPTQKSSFLGGHLVPLIDGLWETVPAGCKHVPAEPTSAW